MRFRTGIAILALLVAAGCGGRKPAASATPDPRDQAVKFAQCMRQHGVDMPDPKQDGKVQIGSTKGGETKVDAAMRACRKYSPKNMANPNDPKERDRMLKMAQCMRQHGVDMPDPQPGRPLALKAKGQDKAKVDAAMNACGAPTQRHQ